MFVFWLPKVISSLHRHHHHHHHHKSSLESGQNIFDVVVFLSSTTRSALPFLPSLPACVVLLLVSGRVIWGLHIHIRRVVLVSVQWILCLLQYHFLLKNLICFQCLTYNGKLAISAQIRRFCCDSSLPSFDFIRQISNKISYLIFIFDHC